MLLRNISIYVEILLKFNPIDGGRSKARYDVGSNSLVPRLRGPSYMYEPVWGVMA